MDTYLQSNENTELESIVRIRNALNNAQSIQTMITNITKQSIIFHNLLSIKPIFNNLLNNNNNYCYIISIQYNATDKQTASLLSLIYTKIIFQLFPTEMFPTEMFSTEMFSNENLSVKI